MQTEAMTYEKALDALESVLFYLKSLEHAAEDTELEQKIYDLTSRALHSNSDDEVSRIVREFENIVQNTGSSLPVQEVFLLWENGRINNDRVIMFLEDCYKWAKSSALKDEVMKWAFLMLWRVTSPAW